MIDLHSIQLSFLANLLVWAAIALASIFKLRLPIYHPFCIYLAYHFLGFVARPLNIVSTGGSFLWERIGIFPTRGEIALVTLIVNVAIICVFLGFFLTSKKTQGYIPPIRPTHLEIRRPLGFWLLLVPIVTAGLYATYRSLAGAGLESVLAYEVVTDSAGGQRLVGISGYVTAMAEFLPIICILLFMTPKMRKLALVVIAAYIGLRLYAGAQRLSFVIVLAAIFLYHQVTVGRRYPGPTSIIIILIFALLFDIAGNDRFAYRRLLEGSASLGEIWTDYRQARGSNALTSDIVEFDVATATTAVVTEHAAFTYGTQYLRLLTWPIPRQIWPGKPVFTSIVNLNDYGDFRYLTIGIYADTYMVLSFISLALLMYLLGAFFAWIYEIARSTSKVTPFMFYWVVLIYTKTILRDGGVTVFYFWAFSTLPVIALSIGGQLRLCRDLPR